MFLARRGSGKSLSQKGEAASELVDGNETIVASLDFPDGVKRRTSKFEIAQVGHAGSLLGCPTRRNHTRGDATHHVAPVG